MNTKYLGLFVMAFFLGYLASQIIGYVNPDLQMPFSADTIKADAPSNHIDKSQILVYNDKVVLNLQGAEWAEFTPTGSMKPVFDENANAIEIVPKSPDEIHIGDIVSYESSFTDGYVIHRVIDIGEDEKGWYAILKGDNNQNPDPEKVRFDKIKRVLVAIIY